MSEGRQIEEKAEQAMTSFTGFEILEQAAFEIIGREANKAEMLATYHRHLQRLLVGQGLDQEEAQRLATKFTEIIEQRHREIVSSAAINLSPQ